MAKEKARKRYSFREVDLSNWARNIGAVSKDMDIESEISEINSDEDL